MPPDGARLLGRISDGSNDRVENRRRAGTVRRAPDADRRPADRRCSELRFVDDSVHIGDTAGTGVGPGSLCPLFGS